MEFQFGDWLVSPEANLVSNGAAKTQLEPRVMAVLRYLCRHPGAVIPAEEILQACWGSNELGDNPVHKAITQLRRAFGDSSTEPRYIETIRKRGYRAIAPVVTFAAPPATTWEGGSPFRGLEAFQENHAAIFFGRVQATAQLRDLVLTQAAHGCPMALVLGPSGSGKTSLVRAGLLPQLMAGAIRSDEPIGLSSTVYLDCADLGSGTLFQALAGALIDAEIDGEPLFPDASADGLGQRLASDPDEVASELRSRACPRAQVGVFVDRLEAVFRVQSSEADRFMQVIEALAKSNCLLMLMACRNDFYPEVMAQPVLLALKTRGGHFDVLPPDGADIAQIVRQPASAADLKFERDSSTGASLDDVLCDAARGNPDMLPLLQYTLNELYRQRDEDGTLTFRVYRELGGIEGAVGVRAEQVVSILKLAQVAALPHVLSLLVNVGEDQAAVTSRRSPLVMLRTEEEKELVRVMVEARLFVSELAGDVPSFGVAHEALLRQWPRVSEWIERYRRALQLRLRLEGQATRWVDAKRSRELLLPSGIQVSQAADLLKLTDFSMTPLAVEYVRASANRARFGERIRFAVMTLIVALAILSGLLGLAARRAQQEAEQKRADAEGLLSFMLGDFVNKLRPIGRLELLDDVTGKALTYLAYDNASTTDYKAIIQRARALNVIHELNDRRKKRTEALEALQAARKLLQSVKKSDQSNADFIRQLAVNTYFFGHLYMVEEDLEKARQSMTEYVRLADQYAQLAPDDTDSWLEQSYAHNSLGSIAMKQSDYKTAADQFNRSLNLKRRVQERKPNDQSLVVDISNSYSWLAESQLKSGNMKEAMLLYKEEDKMLRSVHQGNALWTYRLVISLLRQSTLSQARGDKAAALDAVVQAESLLEQILKLDSDNRSWLMRLYQSKVRIIELKEPERNLSATLMSLKDLCEQIAALSAQDKKNSNLRFLLARSRNVQAQFLNRSGRNNDAKEILDNEIASLDSFKDSKKSDPVYLGTYGEVLLARSTMAFARNDFAYAERDCDTVLELLDQPGADSSDYALLALQVRAHICKGDQQKVRPHMATLDSMGFKDADYIHYISTHPTKKGIQ